MLFCSVDGYVLKKHVSSIFGQNIRYEDESDYSETLVNIYQPTRRQISVRFSNVKFVKLAAERLNLRGLVNIVIIIHLSHKTNSFLIIKATISFPITIIHKITSHYHMRYKSEVPLKSSLCMQLQKSQTTQSRVAEGLTKHIHTIILVRSNEMASGNGVVYMSSHLTGTHITTPYTAMKKY